MLGCRVHAQVTMITDPTLLSGAFPLYFISNTNLFGWLNRLTYTIMFSMLWMQEKKKINAWRVADLGLPAMKTSCMS